MQPFQSPYNRYQNQNPPNPYAFNLKYPMQNNEGRIERQNNPNNYQYNANFHDNISFTAFEESPVHQNQKPQQIKKEPASFARNFKARLFNVDPNQQRQKEEALKKYRDELRIQMEDDRARKQREKEKLQQQDLKDERQYNQKMKIQAQKKGGAVKDEPNYFMMRSAKANRKKNNQLANSRASQKEKLTNNYVENQEEHDKKPETKAPVIARRGGYHNKSSLDTVKQTRENKTQQEVTPKNNTLNMRRVNIEEEYIRQKSYEEERIAKLLLFQDNMLKKLDSFKKQIAKTSNHLELNKELERIRFNLRAKQIDMTKINSKNMRIGVDDIFENNSEFYQLPSINNRARYSPMEKKTHQKIITQVRDQNIPSFSNLKSQQSQDELDEPKYPLKLNDKQSKIQQFAIKNDKNFAPIEQTQNMDQNAQQQQIEG